MKKLENLHPRTVTGWRTGFHTLLASEIKRWWSSRRWLMQSLLWILLIDGMIGLIGLVRRMTPELEDATGNPAQLFGLIGILSSIGVVILMQNVIIDEKVNGVAGWILSKPVSRPAYILAKLTGNLLGILVTVVVIPGIVAYPLISQLFVGEWLGGYAYLAALGVVSLEVTFYLCLTLMLGAIFSARGVVLAVPLAFIFGQQPAIGLFKELIYVLPYTLSSATAGAVALGGSVPFPVPMISTAVWCILFVGLAIWRFGQEDF